MYISFTFQCFSADNILDIYHIHDDEARIDANKFEKMCPALIYQLNKKTCAASAHSKGDKEQQNSWKGKL